MFYLELFKFFKKIKIDFSPLVYGGAKGRYEGVHLHQLSK